MYKVICANHVKNSAVVEYGGSYYKYDYPFDLSGDILKTDADFGSHNVYNGSADNCYVDVSKDFDTESEMIEWLNNKHIEIIPPTHGSMNAVKWYFGQMSQKDVEHFCIHHLSQKNNDGQSLDLIRQHLTQFSSDDIDTIFNKYVNIFNSGLLDILKTLRKCSKPKDRYVAYEVNTLWDELFESLVDNYVEITTVIPPITDAIYRLDYKIGNFGKQLQSKTNELKKSLLELENSVNLVKIELNDARGK